VSAQANSILGRRQFLAGAAALSGAKRYRVAVIGHTGRSRGHAFTRLAGRTTVPLFILVPQVTVRKRLDVDSAARKWLSELPRLVVRQWRD